MLDASLALSWFFKDERDAAAIDALRYVAQNGALVPALWSTEVVHVLVKGERRGRLSREQTSGVLEYLRALPIAVEM
ncbi:MAG: type II toxin-antitoxin system VapC family toxin [Candidatus Baltobacteraceae bacterium]